MKLSEFIKETLVEIANGAKMAKEEYANLGDGYVCPYGYFKTADMPSVVIKSDNEKHEVTKPVVSVNFKLNVQAEETEKVGGILSVISASVGASKGEANKSVQEISFSIPVILPTAEKRK